MEVLFIMCAITLSSKLCHVYSHADEMPCSKKLEVGEFIMGSPAEFDSKRSVQIFRGLVELKSGDFYNDHEELSVFLSSSKGEFIFEAKNALFASELCDGRRSLEQGATLIMPADKSEVLIWAGWAKSYEAVRITPSLQLYPNLSSKAVPSAFPTLLKVEPKNDPVLKNDSYNIQVLFNISGCSIDQFGDILIPTIRRLWSTKLQLSMNRLILFNPKLSENNLLLYSLAALGLTNNNALSWTMPAIDFTLEILNLYSPDAIDTIITSLSDYVLGDFVSDLVSSTQVSVHSVHFKSYVLLPGSSTASEFKYSCPLSPSMSMAWSVSPSQDSVRLYAINMDRDNWISLGVTQRSEVMVTTEGRPHHSVYIYSPSLGMAGTYTLNGLDSSQIPRDDRRRRNTYVENVRGGESWASVTIVRAVNTGVQEDPVLDLQGDNHVIWAHGAKWPREHIYSGFVRVSWATGKCVVEGDYDPSRDLALGVFFVPILIVLYAQLSRGTKSTFLSKQFALYGVGVITYSTFAGLVLYILVSLSLAFLISWSKYSAGYSIARSTMNGLGSLTAMNLWISLLPNAKTDLWRILIGLPYQTSIKFHKLLTSVSVFLALAHFILARALFGDSVLGVEQIGSAFPRQGLYALVLYVVVFTSSLLLLRTKTSLYHLFTKIHWLYIPTVIFLSLHVPWIGLGFAPGVLLHVVSYFYRARRLVNRNAATGVTVTGISEHSSVVTLRVSGLAKDHVPGSYYYLHVQDVNGYEWHPFSVAGARSELVGPEEVTFHIKSSTLPNTWTSTLRGLVGRNSASHGEVAPSEVSQHDSLRPKLYVSLDGPYGSMNVDAHSYRYVVMVAGGIGITPFLHLLKLLRKQVPPVAEGREAEVIWVMREEGLWKALGSELVEAVKLSDGRLSVRVQVFITGRDAQPLPTVSGVRAVSGVHESRAGITYGAVSTLDKGLGHDDPVVIEGVTVNYGGRPHITRLLLDLLTARQYSASNSKEFCVLACGPSALSQVVSNVSFRVGVDFHLEQFSFS